MKNSDLVLLTNDVNILPGNSIRALDDSELDDVAGGVGPLVYGAYVAVSFVGGVAMAAASYAVNSYLYPPPPPPPPPPNCM